jgi:hypothetical protein
MFSHGMGGGRAAYSSVCGEFATYGFCCLRHGASGWRRCPNTHTPKGLGSRLEREAAGGLKRKPGSDKHSFDVVDFHFPPKDDLNGASPDPPDRRKASQSTDRDASRGIGRSIYSNGHNLRQTG